MVLDRKVPIMSLLRNIPDAFEFITRPDLRSNEDIRSLRRDHSMNITADQLEDDDALDYEDPTDVELCCTEIDESEFVRNYVFGDDL